MLYTIIPLEQIYKDKDSKQEELQQKEIPVENGVLSLKWEKDHYVVDKLWSTDMKDYLNDDYKPGSIRKI